MSIKAFFITVAILLLLLFGSIFARVFMEWTGKYLLSDNPIRLQQEPIMIYDVK